MGLLEKENCRDLFEWVKSQRGLVLLNIYPGQSKAIDLLGTCCLRSCCVCNTQEHEASAAAVLVSRPSLNYLETIIR